MPVPDLQQPFYLAALIGVSGFLGWLIKDVITDLRKQRDASEARVGALTKAVEDLTDVVKDGFRERGR